MKSKIDVSIRYYEAIQSTLHHPDISDFPINLLEIQVLYIGYIRVGALENLWLNVMILAN